MRYTWARLAIVWIIINRPFVGQAYFGRLQASAELYLPVCLRCAYVNRDLHLSLKLLGLGAVPILGI